MTLQLLSPDPATWRITAVAPVGERLVVQGKPVRAAVACPVCGTRSWRVQSRSRRQPWDLSWGRWPVQLLVQARRFFCDAPTCRRRSFVEPCPRLLARYDRQTERRR